MLFYWGLWLFFLVLALSLQDKFVSQSFKILFLLIFILAILTGGRENVGADWESYQTYYYTGYAYEKASGKMEPLFTLMRQACFGLGLSYGFFCFVCSLLSLSVLCAALKRMGVRNCFLAFSIYLSLFFCNYQFNIIRHGILASFVLLGFSYLSKDKSWKAVFSFLVGSGFHMMGLLFIPFVFFIKNRISIKAVIVIVAASFLMYFADFSGRVISAFPMLAAVDRVAGYVDPGRENVYKLSVGIIGFLVISIYTIVFLRNDYENNAAIRITSNLLLCGFVVFGLFNGFSALVQRIGNLMNLGVIVVLPYIYNRSRSSKRFCVLLLLVAYMALYYPKTWNVPDEFGNYSMLPFVTNISNLF